MTERGDDRRARLTRLLDHVNLGISRLHVEEYIPD